MMKHKRRPLVFVTCVIVMMFILRMAQRRNQIQVHVVVQQPVSHHVPGEYGNVISNKKIYTDTNPRTQLIITEEESLATPPCNDSMTIPSATRSSINIIDADTNGYSLGDTIRILVQLMDSYGNRIQQGGHLIRSTMSNETLGAYSTGMVTDHRDGTYLVEFEALWTGTSVIVVAIDYSREAIAASYRLRNIYPALNRILGTYTNGEYKEEVLCHPDAKRLVEQAHYKDVCNYTALNWGHEWYCGSPTNPHLLCQDWHLTGYSYIKEKFPITDCEQSALLRTHTRITQTVPVHVNTTNSEMGTLNTVIALPKQPCVKTNITDLWQNTGRTGFFYEKQWTLRQCQGIDVNNIPSCLKDKTLYLIGDSTVRQWYVDVKRRFKCTQYTETWTKAKWERLSGCFNKEYNITVIYVPHLFPSNLIQHEEVVQAKNLPVTKTLDKIPTEQNAIVLIHIYTHLWGYHHRYFRDKMLKLREGVERLIRRNSFAKLLLKIPHTFTERTPNGGRNDMIGYIFTDIMKEVFKGIYDKVIYLDNRESSTAVNSKGIHPEGLVVWSMVSQMFSYVCE